MKRKNLRNFAAIALLVAVAGLSSSCNRGYGCPTNFSVNDATTTVVTWAINYLK